ncbi:MAG: NAD(P)-dependent oxidoreductase [Candidatus Omnitrophica bacterium]|nr:NAD(P)-dependent oxidoreductase [Candidatus Omnitrophota bacterium]
MQKSIDKKILITGGNGFLGSHLFYQLKRICKQVYLYEGDVRGIGSFSKHYDIVCHLAAINKTEHNDVGLLFDTNVNGTLAVMRYCLRVGAKCIFASSSAVYKPTKQNKRITEHSCIRPASLYGVSKMLAENICKYYAENFGVSVVVLRIFNIYGPGQEAPFLIPDITRQLPKNKSISLISPMACRDFVYVTDVVKAFILSCRLRYKRFLILNVGTGECSSVYNFAKKFLSRIKPKAQLNKGAINSLGRDYVIANIRNISKILKWHPTVSREDGLTMIVNTILQKE